MENKDIDKKQKEVQKMDATMSVKKSLNLSKLANRKHTVISSKQALSDVTPINWSDDVLSGKRKVIITKDKEE